MKIAYFLVRLFFDGFQNKYRAQIQRQPVLSREELAERMANKHTAFSVADIIGVFKLMHMSMLEAVREGFAVDGVMGMLKYSIQGTFNSPEDAFDHSRHAIKPNVQVYSEFVDAMKHIHVEKITKSTPGPLISLVKDGTDEMTDIDILQTGGVVKVIGENLKIVESDSGNGQGIFFIAEDGTETQATRFIDNTPSRLTFMLPASLETGNYQLVLRTYFNKNHMSKKLLKGSYANLLQVVSS